MYGAGYWNWIKHPDNAQVGVVIKGGGLNIANKIFELRVRGFAPIDHGDYITYH